MTSVQSASIRAGMLEVEQFHRDTADGAKVFGEGVEHRPALALRKEKGRGISPLRPLCGHVFVKLNASSLGHFGFVEGTTGRERVGRAG